MLYKKKRIKLSKEEKDLRSIPRLLRKLNPRRFLDRMHELLAIVLSADSTLAEHFIIWLETSFGASARKIYNSALYNIQTQLSFETSSKHGWCIACLTEDESSNLDDNEGTTNESLKVIKVPCTSIDESISGEVAAAIWAGDYINIPSKKKIWWKVHELHPERRTILLLECDENKEAIKSKYQYYEIHPIFILGATVRRIGYITKEKGKDSNNIHDSTTESNSQTNINDIDFSTSNIESIEYFFQIPKPNSYEAIENLKNTVHEEQRLIMLDNSNNDDDNNKTRNEPMHKIQNIAHVTIWLEKKAQEQRARELLNHINTILIYQKELWLAIGRALRIISRGSNSLLQDWKHWSEQGLKHTHSHHQRYQHYHQHHHPSPSQREQSQSQQRSSLQSQYQLQCQLQERGQDWDLFKNKVQQRVRHCQDAWECQRVYTNCDHPAICRARAFLRSHLSSNEFLELTTEEYTSSSNLELLKIPTHALDVIDCAVEVLEGKPLKFVTPPVKDPFGNNVIDSLGNRLKYIEEDIIIPLAIYETKILPKKKYEINENIQQKISSHLINMSECAATIEQGDLIALQGAFGEGSNVFWHIVLEIDILLAKLKIQPCEEPPFAWLKLKLNDDEDIDDEEHVPYVWIPISQLWGVSVARFGDGIADLDNDHHSYENEHMNPINKKSIEIKHRVFVTPCPQPAEAIHWLENLARDYPVIATAADDTPVVSVKTHIQGRELVRDHRRRKKSAWK